MKHRIQRGTGIGEAISHMRPYYRLYRRLIMYKMGAAMASGEMAADYNKNKPTLSPTKLEDFAKEFARAYANS